MKMRRESQFMVLSCLIMAASCSTNYNTIEDVDGENIWDQDISDEIDSLDAVDRNELFTLASQAFAWITGTEEMCGQVDDTKMVDWFGFYYYQSIENDGNDTDGGPLRDVTGRALLEMLDSNQRQLLYDTVVDLDPEWSSLYGSRNAIVHELYNLKIDAPFHETVLEDDAATMGQKEREIAVETGDTFRQILTTLSGGQIDQINDFRDGLIQLPETTEVDNELQALDSGLNNPLITLAARCLTWLSSTRDMCEEIDPGRIANYFGFNFYKDEQPALGPHSPPKQRADIGLALLETLTLQQRQIFYDLLDEQGSTLEQYLTKRSEIVDTLFDLQESGAMDEDLFENLCEASGNIDGSLAMMRAQAYSEVFMSLDEEQLAHLEGIRDGSVLWEP